MSIEEAAKRARRRPTRILADLATATHGVVVDSPPGAGKSTLVVARRRRAWPSGASG